MTFCLDLLGFEAFERHYEAMNIHIVYLYQLSTRIPLVLLGDVGTQGVTLPTEIGIKMNYEGPLWSSNDVCERYSPAPASHLHGMWM